MTGVEAGVDSPTPALDLQRQALLAVGVVEYQSTYEALAALRRMGVEVPYRILASISTEQRLLMIRWQRDYGTGSVAVGSDGVHTIVDACRAWVTEHQDHITEYLEGR